MFFKDGFVYGGEPEAIIKVKAVKILQDHMMLIEFNNGETRLFDASLLTGKAFEPLMDEGTFANCAVDHGVPTWCDGEIDCAPEFLYANSYEYAQVG